MNSSIPVIEVENRGGRDEMAVRSCLYDGSLHEIAYFGSRIYLRDSGS